MDGKGRDIGISSHCLQNRKCALILWSLPFPFLRLLFLTSFISSAISTCSTVSTFVSLEYFLYHGFPMVLQLFTIALMAFIIVCFLWSPLSGHSSRHTISSSCVFSSCCFLLFNSSSSLVILRSSCVHLRHSCAVGFGSSRVGQLLFGPPFCIFFFPFRLNPLCLIPV